MLGYCAHLSPDVCLFAVHLFQLKAAVKSATCQFLMHHPGVMDAFLSNPLTAFLPLVKHPYQISKRSAMPDSTMFRITYAASTSLSASALAGEYKEAAAWQAEVFKILLYCSCKSI